MGKTKVQNANKYKTHKMNEVKGFLGDGANAET
jgi:hypothetical protein